jgi:hypothetical protein
MRELINVMTQPKEQLIDIAEIEKALEAVTPGEWEVVDLDPVQIAIGYKFQDGIHTAKWIAEIDSDQDNGHQHADAWLIANAPKWLRALLEENKRLKRDKAETMRLVIQRDKEHAIQLQQTREELERYQGMYQRTEDQLGSEIKTSAYLRTELSAKDKVLEWYGNKSNWEPWGPDRNVWMDKDKGEQARTILQQYTNRTDKGEGTDAPK